MNLRQKILGLCDRALAALIVGARAGQRARLRRGGLVVPAVPGRRRVPAGRGQAGAAPGGGQDAAPQEPAHAAGPAGPRAWASCSLPPCPRAWPAGSRPRPTRSIRRGLYADLAHADDPEAALPEAPGIRSPASLDRSATLRWLVGGAACLGIFWAVSHFTDRLGRLYLVWGLVVAGFLLNAALAVVQITNRSEGLYGLFLPGDGPAWAPPLERPAGDAGHGRPPGPAGPAAPAPRGPCRPPCLTLTAPFLFGTMMGGPGAFLAFGTLAMPLAMAIVLHLVSPRGSRESLSDRLGNPARGAWCSCS